jgi:phosphonate dehydrogenase
MGAVGRATAERLLGFGPTLLYHDERRLDDADPARLRVRYAPLETLLANSDFLVLALPLTPRTKHLISGAALARMKPGAYLVNPARGSLVDEEAVADALATGRLAGYAADVFEMEDWARPDRPPTIAPRLMAGERHTVLTPHLGSGVDGVRRDIARAAARDIVAVLADRIPAGAVNRPAGASTPR